MTEQNKQRTIYIPGKPYPCQKKNTPQQPQRKSAKKPSNLLYRCISIIGIYVASRRPADEIVVRWCLGKMYILVQVLGEEGREMVKR